MRCEVREILVTGFFRHWHLYDRASFAKGDAAGSLLAALIETSRMRSRGASIWGPRSLDTVFSVHFHRGHQNHSLAQ